MFRLMLLLPLLLPAAGRAGSGFSLQDDGRALLISDGAVPVLAYNYGRVDPPEGVDPKYWRSGYIHPLWGLDGDVLSDDFPADHPHHRGVFWTWPQCRLGEREVDPWALTGARQLFGRWKSREVRADEVVVEVENHWILEEGEPVPFVREDVRLTVLPADGRGRAIDFEITLTNVSRERFSLRGRGATGYGGFNFRPDARRPDKRITAATGHLPQDALIVPSPWTDFSSRTQEGAPFSGVAIFQHPRNPDYPHPGWILRYYGFLGASWPQYREVALQPGESVAVRYRLFVHRGSAEEADVGARFRDFASAAR